MGDTGSVAIVSLRGKSVGLISVRAQLGKVDMVEQVSTLYGVTVPHENSVMRRSLFQKHHWVLLMFRPPYHRVADGTFRWYIACSRNFPGIVCTCEELVKPFPGLTQRQKLFH